MKFLPAVDGSAHFDKAVVEVGRLTAGAEVVMVHQHSDNAADHGPVVPSPEADIIVVGPRGLGRLSGLLVASVTNRSVRLSDRLVLVVR